MEKFEYTDEMKAISDDVWAGLNVFMTGGAGVGKSSLIAELKKQGLRFLFLAPTGLIASNGVVAGKTLHSFFKIPFKFAGENEIKPLNKFNKITLENVDAIVIDEISMARADTFNFIDKSLKANLNDPRPFGGKQIILVGDIFQLPPVISNSAEKKALNESFGGRYFFQTKAYEEGKFVFRELTKVFRQKDQQFIDILNSIKLGKISSENLRLLNTRCVKSDDEKGVVISPQNAYVDKHNSSMLMYEDGKYHEFKAKFTGEFNFKNTRMKEHLELKEGCKVMLLANNYEYDFVNGDIGIFEGFNSEDGMMYVTLDNGRKIRVPVTTENNEEVTFDTKEKKIKSVIIGQCTQFPITLAYSISIHKSQGMTFSSVVFDKGGGIFDYGQLYVALSRGRSMDTLYLTKPISQDDIFIDDSVIDFYNTNK